jgi:hypothetical protein
MPVKKPLRVMLWIVGVCAVIFAGLVIYTVSHRDALELHAEVGKSLTSLYVTNIEKQDWTECLATLNDGKFTSPKFSVRAGERYQVPFIDFAAKDGLRFDVVRYSAKDVEVTCGPLGYRRSVMFAVN